MEKITLNFRTPVGVETFNQRFKKDFEKFGNKHLISHVLKKTTTEIEAKYIHIFDTCITELSVVKLYAEMKKDFGEVPVLMSLASEMSNIIDEMYENRLREKRIGDLFIKSLLYTELFLISIRYDLNISEKLSKENLKKIDNYQNDLGTFNPRVIPIVSNGVLPYNCGYELKESQKELLNKLIKCEILWSAEKTLAYLESEEDYLVLKMFVLQKETLELSDPKCICKFAQFQYSTYLMLMAEFTKANMRSKLIN